MPKLFEISLCLRLLSLGCSGEPDTLRGQAEQAQQELEEAREDAASIIAESEENAVEIVADAREEAREQIEDAKREASEAVTDAEQKLERKIEALKQSTVVDDPEQTNPVTETDQATRASSTSLQ
ncbi:hypothetical protein [Rhodopirellula sp. SWK7]|uniref:hypothetical protein n=1 Tax=Rhodopirellula sp. SWK7 TaxID=595460 RepID=UPI0002BD6845|nr:hypothetical protein [Rhodopirellula sp. SWK7]EMI45123.1 hypothetical protein RRSWK_02323 [Rhodopirellula sp. SWK7]